MKIRGGAAGSYPVPNLAGTIKVTDFNDKWNRKFDVKVAGTTAIDKVEQQITYMDPYWIYMVSPTHRWRLGYRTTEMDPVTLRKLLAAHPDLSEPDGKCDPVK